MYIPGVGNWQIKYLSCQTLDQGVRILHPDLCAADLPTMGHSNYYSSGTLPPQKGAGVRSPQADAAGMLVVLWDHQRGSPCGDSGAFHVAIMELVTGSFCPPETFF